MPAKGTQPQYLLIRAKKQKHNNNNNSNNSNNSNNYNNNNYNDGGNSGANVPESVFELGKSKRVTVRQFRGVNLIDIREYYKDSSSGEYKPGKKGISLTEELYDSLIRQRRNIDDALRRMGSKRSKNGLLDSIRDQDTASSTEKKSDQNDKNNTASATGSATGSEKSELKRKHEQSEGTAASGAESDKKPKLEIAPPQLLPNEAAKRQEELENTAAIVIPGGNKPQEQKKDAQAIKKEQEEGLNSSDEEFAAGLEADMQEN
ncbi:hypothetical protein ACO0RG_001938 [Hanseniaspora osmophila]